MIQWAQYFNRIMTNKNNKGKQMNEIENMELDVIGYGDRGILLGNCYGPAETSVSSTVYLTYLNTVIQPLTTYTLEGTSVPIGIPLVLHKHFILNKWKQLAIPGMRENCI